MRKLSTEVSPDYKTGFLKAAIANKMKVSL